jgi:dipeptidyl aminopeptidase/acylaminoacyl peptidase
MPADLHAHLHPGLHTQLIEAWGSWAPTLSPDGRCVVFISDRTGRPELWRQDITGSSSQPLPAAVPIALTDDPVVGVSWSADGDWLAAAVAAGGGVRTQVWVLRPDGTDAHQVGDHEHATLGPWTRSGHRVVVAAPPHRTSDISHCDLIDPVTGGREAVAHGALVNVISLSADGRYALLRDGTRGAHFCVTLDRELDHDHPLLPYPGTGSTEGGLLRPSPGGDGSLVAYLLTDAGLPRAALAAVAVGPEGVRGEAGIVAERDDGELELIDADDAGQLLTLVWNVGGRSVLELLRPVSGERSVVDSVPGAVITGCVLARDGASAVLSIDGPASPQQLWRLEIARGTWRQLSRGPVIDAPLVAPVLVEVVAHDGLPLSGWLYRPPGQTASGPAVIHLHGGPESQERPVFSANHQALVAAGITVFAPNIRGSAGYGRSFAHADDRYGRYDAISDVRSCARHLVETGIADPDRIAVAGRSYGGYATLAALTGFPDVFAAGVDMCGMSDLLTFFRDTEPWIAAAAVTKYGDPEHDRVLLEDLSPLRQAARIKAPLLVVHGELDTNVPLNEAKQVVAAVQAAGGQVEYLELAGEGHEYRSRAARLLLVNRLVEFLGRHL